MVRTLKRTRSRRQQETVVLFPGEGQWEIWKLGQGEECQFDKTIETLAKASLTSQTILALPVQHVFSLPLWLLTIDETLIPDLIYAQVEKRGLVTRSREETVIQYDIVIKEESQTLVLAAVLPGNILPELLVDRVKEYELSARLLPLLSDQITIWRERDRLVMGVTRGSNLVYFQALSDSEITPAVLQDLICVKLQLETQKIIDSITGIHCWISISPQQQKLLGDTLRLPIHTSTRPFLKLPQRRWRLIPNSVRAVHAGEKQRIKKRKGLLGAAALYFLFILIMAARALFLGFQGWKIRSELAKDAPTVKTIKETMARWDAMELAIDTNFYCIEILSRCHALLPEEGGVQLTLFNQTDFKIQIVGEAKNSQVAIKYGEDLKKSKDLALFQWSTPFPTALPNEKMKFTFEGTGSHATAN